ncbi:MAG: hybrid sensor histidine kinase/response regulator [Flavobacterium sp.]|nr:MAG: hybrid sensor histidine kinase/response regulator [Flavobacterium sp.]
MTSFLNKNITLSVFFVWFFFLLQIQAQENIQDTLSLVKSHQKGANKAILSQDFSKAINYLNKACDLVTPTKDILLKASVNISFAKFHYNLHNYNKAASLIIKAIAQLKDTDDKLQQANAALLYGQILTQLEKFENAEKHLKIADSYFTELKDDINQALTLVAIGKLELKKGNPKVAINYFEAGLPILISNNLKHNEVEVYIFETEALLQLQDTENNKNLFQAKAILIKAIAIIETNKFNKLKIDSFRISSLIAIRENNPNLASRFIISYTYKKDSMYSSYLNIISSNIERDTNIGDLNEIIALQQNDLDKKQKSINFGKMTTGLSIALIIILSLLALSLFKNNNLRAKANDLLKDKNIELTLAKEKAERASLAKAQFLSTITHELRTPLYAVTGLTHLLLEEDPKPNQKEHLNSLKFSGEYLLSLINNILDLNKLEANKVEIEKTTFSFKKRINDVLIALKKTAEDRKNTLTFEYDESIPEKLIGDPLKLSQVLINLIGNSVKFTQNGDVTIRVQKNNSSKDRVNLRIEIEDTGVGISKKKQKSIFETFNQGSLQINRKFGGSGLGLSIVKNLLELMNSKINLESTLGQGSKFWFDISFNISESLQDVSNLNNETYNIDYKALENVSILVVEDNKINQMITKKILEKNKFICKVADNGMDAIKMVHENDFEVILMDIHMPGISGIETTQRIREFNKELPIIALTAVTIDENLDEFYKAGFNEIIPKPFKPEDFFEKIYRTLEASKTSAS